MVPVIIGTKQIPVLRQSGISIFLNILYWFGEVIEIWGLERSSFYTQKSICLKRFRNFVFSSLLIALLCE